VVERTPAHVHAAWAIGVVAAALAGVAAGALLMRVRFASAPPPEPVVIKGDPVVEVHYPQGTSLSVAGRTVTDPSPATVSVRPGTPTSVKITRPGYPATETQVQLDYNQMRVISFTTRDVPGPPTPEGPP
jgi:hypothetical protein